MNEVYMHKPFLFNFIHSAVIFSSMRAGVWGSKGGVVTDLFGVPKEACSQICHFNT